MVSHIRVHVASPSSVPRILRSMPRHTHGSLRPSQDLEADSPVDYASYCDRNGQMRTNAPASPHHTKHPSRYYAPQPSTRDGLYFTQRPLNNPHSEHPGYNAASGGYDRKCTFDAVDESFGSAKHREIDPLSYAQIDYSLIPLPSSLSIYNSPMAANGQYILQSAGPAVVHGGPALSQNPSAH
ncbi:hypothetical protein FOMA001_g13251 [Fusarium oxysporum f. sp. matthiolae]|nr:hypothetical protein FOMA001_g13251 [Fusarium oxysporum f. sp. matthiolae]